jgi:hypothetical protein
MLQKLFLISKTRAFQHAVEVDTTGRTIVLTCELPEAEYARDQIHAYGADATLRALRERAPASALFVPHGHGLGLAYVDGFSAEDVEGLARDIVAYDQRGCLSPLEVLVKGEGDEAERFAASLHATLSELDASMPRQPLGPAEAAAHAQWRGVAVATGRLLEGAGHALAVEGYARMPPPPGARTLVVARCEGRADAEERWVRHGRSLKALGVSRACLRAGSFPRPLGCAPRVSELGWMQRPAFDAAADGRPAEFGLLWRADA